MKEIENRLREVEGRLLDAAAQTARLGLFSTQIDLQLRGVRELLAVIETHITAASEHCAHPSGANRRHGACTSAPAED